MMIPNIFAYICIDNITLFIQCIPLHVNLYLNKNFLATS